VRGRSRGAAPEPWLAPPSRPLRQNAGIRLVAATALLSIATTACSLNDHDSTTPEGPRLASGRAVPTRCVPQTPPTSSTIAFVANGHAWALSPAGRRLTCLFRARRPGPFTWGPRGDRALLARLEVKSFGRAPSRPPTSAAPGVTSWGRPIGKAVVFVGRGGRALLKAHPAGGGFEDVTPLEGVRYEQVVYHPSGLAFAFVVRRERREEVWISSNTGAEPRQLVHGRFHTDFDSIAFSRDGRVLYFAAQHADGHVDIHRISPAGATEAPVEWSGGPQERVTDIVAGPGGALAFAVGRSCATRRAVVITGANPGVDALPDADTSKPLGWIDDTHLLVASGACGRSLDLYSVALPSLKARLLVERVAAAAIRRAEALPPPPLPSKGEEGGSGLA
jgi:hypothetical protein